MLGGKLLHGLLQMLILLFGGLALNFGLLGSALGQGTGQLLPGQAHLRQKILPNLFQIFPGQAAGWAAKHARQRGQKQRCNFHVFLLSAGISRRSMS